MNNESDLDSGDQGFLILETKSLPAKVKIWNQSLTDACFVAPLLFEMCDLHLLLDLNFIKKTLIEKDFIFETWKF